MFQPKQRPRCDIRAKRYSHMQITLLIYAHLSAGLLSTLKVVENPCFLTAVP